MADWNPDDPVLKGLAPHEPSGILRWHKARVPSHQIMKLLRLRGTQLVKHIEVASEQTRKAEQVGMPIHSPLMPPEDP
jgi:hypothetical protein